MSPTSNWLTQAARVAQEPVYYIAIDGLATPHYSTAPVRSPTVETLPVLDVPEGFATSLDLLAGTRGVSTVAVTLHDAGAGGARVFADGGVEAWDSATDLTSWDEFTAGGDSVNRDGSEQRSGDYCARLDHVTGGAATIFQTPTLTPGKWYHLTARHKMNAARSDGLRNVLWHQSGTAKYWDEATQAWSVSNTPTRRDSGPAYRLFSLWFLMESGFDPTTPTVVNLGVDDLGGAQNGDSIYYDDLALNGPFDAPTDRGVITTLVSTEAAGAPVASLVNRKVTVYAGYRALVESDYAAVFTGRVRGVAMGPGMTSYRLDLADLSYQLDGEIMPAATEAAEVVLEGNVVNLAASILRDVFDTGDADFPLDSISGTPGGLGIADADLDVAGMKAVRDLWHPDDVARVTFRRPEPGRAHLQGEFTRAWQAFWTLTGTGQLGFAFDVPALPQSAATAIGPNDIAAIDGWSREYGNHLNRFVYEGDYDATDNEFDTELYNTETAEDTANQAATGQTIEYRIRSKWIRTTLDGVAITKELAGRRRLRYLETPALLDLLLTFRQRALVEGEVVAVTHPEIPDLRTGGRGVTSRLMTVVRLTPDFLAGAIRVSLLDTGYRRYGVIAPSTASSAYTAATDQEKNTFFYICDADDQEFSDGDPGMRFI